jgi:hypothetical protein
LHDLDHQSEQMNPHFVQDVINLSIGVPVAKRGFEILPGNFVAGEFPGQHVKHDERQHLRHADRDAGGQGINQANQTAKHGVFGEIPPLPADAFAWETHSLVPLDGH